MTNQFSIWIFPSVCMSKIILNTSNGFELGKPYDALGLLLNGCHHTDCDRLPLTIECASTGTYKVANEQQLCDLLNISQKTPRLYISN
jgi:hypothetical protein